MRLTISRDSLHYALAVASRAAGSGNSLFILTCLLLEAEAGKLKVTGFDLESAVTVWIPADITQPGQCCIPAKLLTSLVATFTGDRVALSSVPSETNAHRLAVQCETKKSIIDGMAPNDYPPVPEPGPTICTIPAAELASAINRVAYAIAIKDAGRPSFTALQMRLRDGKLILYGADGYRLARTELDVGGDADLIALPPLRAIRDLAAILAKRDEPVEIAVAPNVVTFRAESLLVTCRLIEGVMANLDQAIPTTWWVRLSLDIKRLLTAVKGAQLFAADNADKVSLIITRTGLDLALGKVRVTGRSVAVGEAEDEWAASVEVADEQARAGMTEFRITLNGKWFIEALSAIPTESVFVELTSRTKPIALRPAGRDDYVAVTMPMATDTDRATEDKAVAAAKGAA